MDATKTTRSDPFAVLAEVARVIADDERRPKFRREPVSQVEGFDTLPDDVQAALAEMTDDELTAVARLHRSMEENGFRVVIGRTSLSMF